ncbi:MAG: hypothetical protein HFJ50_02470 [Clostridia bacterium]|jgi:outer membrane biosynthesis protein TonB|nr:hypothetical protein [Clostridia bacterium]
MRNDRRPDRRRSSNGHKINEGGFSLKSALYVALIILALGLIAFFITINVYNKSLNKAYSDIETKAVGESKEQETLMDKAEEASSQIGKSVEEQETNEVQVVHESETTEVQEQESTSRNEEPKVENNVPVKKEEPKEEVKEEPVKDPEFEKPVEGERLKEFAKDKLVYSETLKEWTGHTGIDIKADKTTVVKAAEARKSYCY